MGSWRFGILVALILSRFEIFHNKKKVKIKKKGQQKDGDKHVNSKSGLNLENQ